jgi:hypothetical protein
VRHALKGLPQPFVHTGGLLGAGRQRGERKYEREGSAKPAGARGYMIAHPRHPHPPSRTFAGVHTRLQERGEQ